MLFELRIRNFAVIDRLDLRLAPGLNVLTGETGAGKSIIVGALSLLVGERASAEVVRSGADRAMIEAVFDVAGRPEILHLLADQGVEADDGLVILRREVAVEGRNRAWVNGSATTAGVVGELGRLLVDLHGQHEHQALLRADEQRAILDAYADAAELAGAVRVRHERVQRLRRQLAELDGRRRDVEGRAALLRAQLEEIEAARLRPEEEAELEAEAQRLEHADELAHLGHQLYQGLYAAEQAVTSRLDELRRSLVQLARLDPSQADAPEVLDSAYFLLDDLGRRLGDYARSIDHDPRRLEAVRQRQELIFRLRRKYGPGLEDVLEAAGRARAELDALDLAGFERRELERELEGAAAELGASVDALSGRRREAAAGLAREVGASLPDLGLAGGTFQVCLTPYEESRADGAEAVEFRVAFNAGAEARPLARTASGGESSRVMVALKTALARVDQVPSLIFDEIDAGIGGRVAVHVAEKLRQVAQRHQVFVITHLPQIASRADHHLRVDKLVVDGATTTRIAELTGEARVEELARMLSGDTGSESGLQHARELLAGVPRG